MANDIDNVRLPEDIERGASGGPTFNTAVITLANGRERRNENWSIPRQSWNIGYGIKKREDLEAVYSFFMARRGRARGFRFRNWLDFKTTNSVVGMVDGDATKRQLIRVYDDPVTPLVRLIHYPVADTLKVYVGGVATTAYTLEEGGVLSFASDPGEYVNATFEYDIPVRFDQDNLNVSLNTYREGVIPSISISELLL